MSITQVDPQVIVGLESELPFPYAMPIGTIFTATDTLRSFVLVSEQSDLLDIRRWQLIIGTGPVYKFSGTMISQTVSGLIGGFGSVSDSIVGPSVSPSDTMAYGAPVIYDVMSESGHQAIGVRVLVNSLLAGGFIDFYRNLRGNPLVVPATPFVSILVNTGEVGEKTAVSTEPFAIGDTLSVGISIAAPIYPDQIISITAVVALNP